MKAMIFAAGLGTRLKPITDFKPKALVEVNDKPLLKHAVEKLINEGFTEIIINVHHFADQIIKYISDNKDFGINIEISDETDMLLDTGGGLKKASWFFNDSNPFLVFNVDVISDISLTDLYNYHLARNGIATLAVRDRSTSRYLLFDNDKRLQGWENKQKGEIRLCDGANYNNLKSLAFSGIQIISPSIFKHFEENGKFSIIETYLRLASKEIIFAYQHDHTTWEDVGKPEQLNAARNEQ
jgi:NDP-sugar pyrophosphorylase family protein